MPSLPTIKEDNGFMREDDADRAKFHWISLTGWKAYGGGNLSDPNAEKIIKGDDASVSPYTFQMNGEEKESHFDLDFLAEIEAHMERGAMKYDKGNWKKATDLNRIFNSILRHTILAFKECDTSENHEAAIVTNALMLWNARKKSK